MPGKADPETLIEHVFSRTGAHDEAVRQGPAVGEDAGAIEVGDRTVVVSSDPISLAASSLGRIAVPVACNDVAASGATPRWLTVTLLLPGTGDDALETVMEDIGDAATDAGVAVIGGHTEVVDALDRPLAVLTALGETDRFVATGGARPGDRLLLTKAAGLEGTAILAGDFGDQLDVAPAVQDQATAFLNEISVQADAAAVREYATAMHDPTEGGLTAAAVELSLAAGVQVEIDRDEVPVRSETAELCAAADVDPLRIFGSGSLLVAVGAEDRDDALAALEDAGIPARDIGSIREADGRPGAAIDGEWVTSPPPDDLYALWASE